ncbi:MAG: MBL fold metallo-hydrolase [bacterium]|nr:MBL fold metallo-hydrolase [bacterium]
MLERMPGLYEFTLSERPGSTDTVTLYLVKGAPGQRSLLIDSGYGTPFCLASLLDALRAADVPVHMLDAVMTHKHADHCGLAHELASRGAVIYMNPEEDRHQYDCLYYRLDHSADNAQLRVLRRTGITKERAPLILRKFLDFNNHLQDDLPIWIMSIRAFDYQPVGEKRFDVGDYSFTPVPLPGHTFGQIGLVDEKHRVFFIADQVLNHTVPIVGTSHVDENLLARYFASIRDIASRYSDWLLLPAHEGPIINVQASVEHIVSAYQRKLEQTLACLTSEKQTVWEVTKQVYGLTPDNRSDAQFYLAKMTITKTFSMLEYLHHTGDASRYEDDGILYWTKSHS